MRKFVIGFVVGVIFSMTVAGTIYPNVAADIMSGDIKSATVEVTQEWFNGAMEWLENGLWEWMAYENHN